MLLRYTEDDGCRRALGPARSPARILSVLIIPLSRVDQRSVALRCYAGGMTTTISQRELRNDNADIMRRVEQGETFVVTRNGTPVADLVPHRSLKRQRFVPVQDVAAGLEHIGDWDVDGFIREREQLDAAVDDTERDSWSAAPTARR